MTKSASAIISASSGKAAEVKGFSGVFSCLLEHEVTKTKATFEYTGPKITPELWGQVMEFFEWTYATEKSEAQICLFVHPEHGWAAWAFPQEGGTGMTSKELPKDVGESAEQRKQFDGGWLYWGTVHHHCSTSAFQSGVDERDESSQEGLHITIGHMDKPMRDIHCRMYIGKHKFEPMMHHFWQLDGALLDKADEMQELFGIYPDMNTAARRAMCQNSTALYASCTPPWIASEGTTLFPPQWKLNYQVKRWQAPARIESPNGQGIGTGYHGVYKLDGQYWCRNCRDWGDHETEKCLKPAIGETPLQLQLSKKQKRRLKYTGSRNLLGNGKDKKDETKGNRAGIILDVLEEQAAVMGFPEKDYLQMIEALASGNNGALMELIMDTLGKEKMIAEDLYMVVLEREIAEEMKEKKETPGMVQEQQINGDVPPWQRGQWDDGGYGG